ncbi:hypothetical protein [Corynebacterium aurimucosum]
MSTVAITITVMTAVVCLATLGVLLYAVIAENPNVEDVGFGLVIVTIITGVAVALAAAALGYRQE